MATRTTVINDPVGIHARPAAQFSQAVTASGCTVTIAKEGPPPPTAPPSPAPRKAATRFRQAPSCPSWAWASSRAIPWSSTCRAPTTKPWQTTC